MGENARPYDYLFKLIVIGDSGVGKSSILTRYIDDSFTSSFISTIGIDFKIKNIIHNDKKIKLQIWDTAGQERFRTITTAYYRGAHGILLVYDTTKLISYQNLSKWIKCIEMHASENIPVILVGSKKDISNEREISAEVGQRRASDCDMDFIEVSAKTGENIDELFGLITKRMYDKNVIITNTIQNNNSDKCYGGKKGKLNSGKDIAQLTFSEVNNSNSLNTTGNTGNTGNTGKNSCIIL